MSQEHDQPTSDVSHVSDAIHPEAAPFEPAYQPETLPQIQVPDLPADAQGLTAEALAQVPTLTELVDGDVVDSPKEAAVDLVVPQEQPEPAEPELAEPEAEKAESASEDAQVDEPVQETPPQADTWAEQLHVRMGKLSDDIHTLNARLDRLEDRNKTKV